MRVEKRSSSNAKLSEAVIETLEQRQMLSVDLTGGRLLVIGTPGDDVIHVHLAEGDPNTIIIDDNVDWGGQSYSFNLRTLAYTVRGGIVIIGDSGNDEIVVDETYGAIKLAFTVDGGDGNNTIIGGSGNDLLIGRAGDDYICGGAGMDFISSGDGFDTLYGSMNPDDASLYGGNPNRDSANVIRGGDDNDYIVGGPKNDRLYGDNGDDTILGMSGNDYIEGNNGDDSIEGDNGYDTIHGNAGNDFIDGGNHDDFIFGDGGNDSLYGGTGSDQLYGGSGDDELHGDAGTDSLDGGAGVDSLWGDLGKDRFKLAGGGGQSVLMDYDPTQKDSIGNFKNTSTVVRKN